MALTPRLLILAAAAPCAAAPVVAPFSLAPSVGGPWQLFVGAAGCDAADSECERDNPEAERLIWRYTLTGDGQLHHASKIEVPDVPPWLLSAPQLPHCLFATLVNKGLVAAFEVVGEQLEPRGHAESGGRNPVHASVAEDGRLLFVANYHGPDWITDSHGASVASLRIAGDCSLTLADVVPHNGSSVVHGRQDSAHPHSFVASLRDQVAYACDLGQDLVMTYAVAEDGGLKELGRALGGRGEGPRHLVQHPTAPFAYVVNELAQSVRVFAIESNGGTLAPLNSFSTLPPDHGEVSTVTKSAELAISPDGSILYVSNRGGLNSVCIFEVVAGGRELKQLDQVPVVAFPRGMLLSPDGSLLLVAGQHAGVVQSFGVGASGKLTPVSNATGPPTTAALTVMTSFSACKASE